MAVAAWTGGTANRGEGPGSTGAPAAGYGYGAASEGGVNGADAGVREGQEGTGGLWATSVRHVRRRRGMPCSCRGLRGGSGGLWERWCRQGRGGMGGGATLLELQPMEHQEGP